MIKGYCQTNLDDFRFRSGWPTLFVAVPRIGERVANDRGFNLKVVGVTHKQRDLKPYIEVELNK